LEHFLDQMIQASGAEHKQRNYRGMHPRTMCVTNCI